MAQQAATSSSDEEEEEVACFERDTESFMLRKRRFMFPGLPPGARLREQPDRARCTPSPSLLMDSGKACHLQLQR